MVMEGVPEDMGEGSMRCPDHPYKNTTPGGICAFCLQEKLGKLVSSSFPISIFPSSSSSSSTSFRSDFGGASSTCAQPVRQIASSSSSSSANTVNPNNPHISNGGFHSNQYYSRPAQNPFGLTQNKKKNKDSSMGFERSKSTTAAGRGMNFIGTYELDEYSPRKRGGFWSFMYLSKHKIDKPCKEICYASSAREAKKMEEFVAVDESESPIQAAFDRKVSRSRSVGCGSRSFSGDFFERISTGFGDCTLRRVESQREGKPKSTPLHRSGGRPDIIKERVKCGGIFSGLMITSSSSSSSSSSYWVPSSAEDNNMSGKAAPAAARNIAHGRNKSWGWALASPIRAFSKPPSGKSENSVKNTTPNLNAIPSLLAVGGF